MPGKLPLNLHLGAWTTSCFSKHFFLCGISFVAFQKKWHLFWLSDNGIFWFVFILLVVLLNLLVSFYMQWEWFWGGWVTDWLSAASKVQANGKEWYKSGAPVDLEVRWLLEKGWHAQSPSDTPSHSWLILPTSLCHPFQLVGAAAWTSGQQWRKAWGSSTGKHYDRGGGASECHLEKWENIKCNIIRNTCISWGGSVLMHSLLARC